MKKINNYINEKLNLNKNSKISSYQYCPKTYDEFNELIENLIKERGDNADLNDVDVSKITDMAYLFYNSKFNGDISKWDVSNVTDMSNMFKSSKFNGDISKWDVSNVTDMHNMFVHSEFNGDISGWNISNVTNIKNMFINSPLQNTPPKWYKK